MYNAQVIVVNDQDHPVGVMEKMDAHRRPVLHRAFSVFIFNTRGEMLLQQRADDKYHSASLWTNACCSHPQPGEQTLAAASRRLFEEMGFSAPLKEAFSFIYNAEVGNGLFEYEFDHVFAGVYDGTIQPDLDEVKDFCFKSMDVIHDDIRMHPWQYTAWFRIAFPQVEEWARMNLAEIKQ